MTHSIPENTSRRQAENFYKGSQAARSAKNAKDRKFLLKCKSVDIGFKALIFESTGKPSEEFEKFLVTLMANSIQVKGMDSESTFGFGQHQLSNLQKFFHLGTEILRSFDCVVIVSTFDS